MPWWAGSHGRYTRPVLDGSRTRSQALDDETVRRRLARSVGRSGKGTARQGRLPHCEERNRTLDADHKSGERQAE